MLDPFCRAHDVENLFVVDASFFPSSAAVNPGLTIVAQALRVADHIRRPISSTAEPCMRARSFSHVGITVSDFNRAVQFYWDVFGCPLVGVADTPPDRVRASSASTAPRRDAARSAGSACPGGGVLEIFEFQPQQPPRPIAVEPRRPDAHLLQRAQHPASGTTTWSARASRSSARRSSRRAATRSSSCKDFDGNLIEIIDLGYMYHVLNWLGPLGGWIFRRGMYKQYYELRLQIAINGLETTDFRL